MGVNRRAQRRRQRDAYRIRACVDNLPKLSRQRGQLRARLGGVGGRADQLHVQVVGQALADLGEPVGGAGDEDLDGRGIRPYCFLAAQRGRNLPSWLEVRPLAKTVHPVATTVGLSTAPVEGRTASQMPQ